MGRKKKKSPRWIRYGEGGYKKRGVPLDPRCLEAGCLRKDPSGYGCWGWTDPPALWAEGECQYLLTDPEELERIKEAIDYRIRREKRVGKLSRMQEP